MFSSFDNRGGKGGGYQAADRDMLVGGRANKWESNSNLSGGMPKYGVAANAGGARDDSSMRRQLQNSQWQQPFSN